ncbi:hypothetical protein SODALDRAFT_362706 [Sodiomyces alkalinus F11]|uniref:Uncharacterized protein n=1 Tax=Sodiomyces alkalinus (strain CBS 110278 / VKM F-3762 / F11) TaxID=1314773 RepID=A0A3N2PN60_SODAK|nr:hypothetical protein SODALDRAFT_362706 [Sodiomyces alkalinus F11]ROT35860.1 hypothetical protein SODALDRAFT_362706 [Sodiomyces alkalinus F11]
MGGEEESKRYRIVQLMEEEWSLGIWYVDSDMDKLSGKYTGDLGLGISSSASQLHVAHNATPSVAEKPICSCAAHRRASVAIAATATCYLLLHPACDLFASSESSAPISPTYNVRRWNGSKWINVSKRSIGKGRWTSKGLILSWGYDFHSLSLSLSHAPFGAAPRLGRPRKSQVSLQPVPLSPPQLDSTLLSSPRPRQRPPLPPLLFHSNGENGNHAMRKAFTKILLPAPPPVSPQLPVMPPQLLPASAAAFAPRASSVNVVLGSRVEPWLTQTLKRINRVKRPLNSIPQHQRCLTETLSSTNAIWNLAALMLPKAPESELRQDDNPLVEALCNFQLVHIQAYIVHVDMVLRNEVAFKLTPDTIDALVEYHEETHCVDAKANTHDWAEKDQQCKKLHEDFVQAINKFVFRTHVSALEGLEEEGAGELLCGKSEEVRSHIMGLMKPLLAPPPRVVDVIRQAPLLPSSPAGASMWSQSQPTPHSHPHTHTHTHTSLPAVDPWRILPSSPSVTSVSQDSVTTPVWTNLALSETQVPSPTPAFSEPFSSAGYFYSSPLVMAPIPALPLPSTFTPQCGIGMGYGGFGWDRYPDTSHYIGQSPSRHHDLMIMCLASLFFFSFFTAFGIIRERTVFEVSKRFDFGLVSLFALIMGDCIRNRELGHKLLSLSRHFMGWVRNGLFCVHLQLAYRRP